MADTSHLMRLLGDQSTAPLDEKLRRFLGHLMNPDAVYFHEDGFPRQHLYQQAAVFFRLIEAGAITVGVPVLDSKTLSQNTPMVGKDGTAQHATAANTTPLQAKPNGGPADAHSWPIP